MRFLEAAISSGGAEETGYRLVMWVGGNGGVNWAEQRVDSGLVALIIGTMPMWVAAGEAVIDRRSPSLFLIGAILTGFLGLGLLILPLLKQGLDGDLPGILVVVLATVSWGTGSLLLSRRPVALDSTVTAGLQMWTGAVGFSLFALAVAEPLPNPTPTAWGAWFYLVIFGSILAFTSFLKALKMLPTQVVMTYTYVNPVIAVFLGWLVLDEPITPPVVAGMGLILAGVWGVFRDRGRRAPGSRSASRCISASLWAAEMWLAVAMASTKTRNPASVGTRPALVWG